MEGIYKKAVELLGKENGIVRAPGCGEKARMVESRRLKERPHLVTPGKRKGNIDVRKTALTITVSEFVHIQWQQHSKMESC